MNESTGTSLGPPGHPTVERNRPLGERDLDAAMFELQAAARARGDELVADGLSSDRPDPLTWWVAAGFILTALLSFALLVELLRA